MATQSVHALTVVATVEAAPAVRALFVQFEHCDEPPLSTPCSADGLTVTHYAAHTAITEAQRQELLAVMTGGGVPSGVEYLITPNDPAGSVTGSSLAGFEPNAGSSPFDLFAAMGVALFFPAD